METEQVVMELKFAEPNKRDNTNYLTHNFHSYPCKFIPQIPRSTILELTKKTDVVLDPFCGCGTTLIEAKLLGRDAIGVDLNPIATLISRAKTTKLSSTKVDGTFELLDMIKGDIENYYNKKLDLNDNDIPKFKNIAHWFQPNVVTELAIIKSHINKLKDGKLKDYLYTAFSSIIVNVSNQESDTRFAAIDKKIANWKTFEEYSRKINDMNKRILEFDNTASDSNIKVYQADSQNLDFIADNTIDHVVTSPPYANTYDYYLYHKFRIWWLDYELQELQEKEIGSRNRHSSKKEDISTFEKGLQRCFDEISRVLKPNKIVTVVIGDSVIRGELIRANEVLKEIALNSNLRPIREIKNKLSESSRMFNPKFTNKDKLEYIMFFKNLK